MVSAGAHDRRESAYTDQRARTTKDIVARLIPVVPGGRPVRKRGGHQLSRTTRTRSPATDPVETRQDDLLFDLLPVGRPDVVSISL